MNSTFKKLTAFFCLLSTLAATACGGSSAPNDETTTGALSDTTDAGSG